MWHSIFTCQVWHQSSCLNADDKVVRGMTSVTYWRKKSLRAEEQSATKQNTSTKENTTGPKWRRGSANGLARRLRVLTRESGNRWAEWEELAESLRSKVSRKQEQVCNWLRWGFARRTTGKQEERGWTRKVQPIQLNYIRSSLISIFLLGFFSTLPHRKEVETKESRQRGERKQEK